MLTRWEGTQFLDPGHTVGTAHSSPQQQDEGEQWVQWGGQVVTGQVRPQALHPSLALGPGGLTVPLSPSSTLPLLGRTPLVGRRRHSCAWRPLAVHP